MILNFLKASYDKVRGALSRTRALFGAKLRALFGSGINPSTIEKLEEILYEADLGVATTATLINTLQDAYTRNPSIDSEGILAIIKQELLTILSAGTRTIVQNNDSQSPTVILVVGVNGSGKTTSVAKLAHLIQKENKKVLLGAADTFRAAAIEQLAAWSHHTQTDIVKGKHKSDPASVAFDAVSAGLARGAEVVIIDTAGRLHTKVALMQELEKVKRSCQKVIPSAPHEILLVLDATIGQNALDQVKTFHSFTPITGLILTKLDGTAKGGIAVAIQKQFGIPIKFIGIGEGMEDFAPFDPEAFVQGLLN